MTDQNLNTLQVAALLFSSSYGIGFLFGSGEMAVKHGMGGSLYGLATSLGMLLLALFAARVWRGALSIWDLFGLAYGAGLKSGVAILSVVWMAGVLAAQIHGGASIGTLVGLSEPVAYGLVSLAIFSASRLDLRMASTVFAAFFLLSGLMLIYMLLAGEGGAFYLSGPALFIADLSTFRPSSLLTIVLAVVILVCTGGDYHQFVLAAKAPRAAVAGCVLAGICLLALSFLPASVVLGLKASGQLSDGIPPKQVIPFAVLHGGGQFGGHAGLALLGGLSMAALGCGAAILRAMTCALASAFDKTGAVAPKRMAGCALAIGLLLAFRGQGIIETMVAVNVLYIASISIVFAALLSGHTMRPRQAGAVMAVGFGVSLSIYAAAWSGLVNEAMAPDLLSLCSGVAASLAAFLVWRAIERRSA